MATAVRPTTSRDTRLEYLIAREQRRTQRGGPGPGDTILNPNTARGGAGA
jgi:hypothetical protein